MLYTMLIHGLEALEKAKAAQLITSACFPPNGEASSFIAY